MKQDVIEAFATNNSDQDTIILRYHIVQEGLDPSTAPPCVGGDELSINLKKHVTLLEAN